MHIFSVQNEISVEKFTYFNLAEQSKEFLLKKQFNNFVFYKNDTREKK